MRNRLAIMSDWVPAEHTLPPGSVGNDHDGAMIYFGCQPWTPDKEGQTPAIVPLPTRASCQRSDTCTVCGSHVPYGMTCAGCLINDAVDGRLYSEIFRDHNRQVERKDREQAEKDSQDFASLKYANSDRKTCKKQVSSRQVKPKPKLSRKRGKSKLQSGFR